MLSGGAELHPSGSVLRTDWDRTKDGPVPSSAVPSSCRLYDVVADG